MQSLLSGADCSTAANPLKQVLRREGVDNSLFKVSITGSNLMFRTDTICPQDRLAPPAGSSSTISRPFSNGPISAPQELRHVNATPHPFNLSHLSADLASHSPTLKSQGNRHLDAEWDRLRGQHVPQRPQKLLDAPQPSAYGAEYSQWNQGNGHQQAQSGWAKTFQLNGKGKERVPSPSQMCSQLQARPYVSQHSYQPFQPMYFNLGQNQAYQPGVINGRSEQEQRDMEAAFERALEDARVESTTKKVQTVRADDEEIEELVREPKGDFEKVWESLRPEAERLGKLAEWESDFSQFVSGEDDLFDTLNQSLARDGIGQTDLDDQLEFGTGQQLDGHFDENDGQRRTKEYVFALPNRFSTFSPASAWAEAIRLLGSGGSLQDATQLLEAFIQRASMEDYQQLQVTDVEAWSLLGRTHAMNEKEEKALSAFEEGRRTLEGEDAGREKVAGEMLTNLAISYVNESEDLAALAVLHQFLRLLHPAHAAPAPQETFSTTATSPWMKHQDIADSLLALAREQYNALGRVDPDVQVGLGTVYYMMGEYDDARGCWVAALGERPDDYLLWNRLGATLANGGNPEEAVDAYRRALELKPTFTRAIFNLGISCLNIGVHREAAEHFLAALSLHDRNASDDWDSNINDSGSLWPTLRRALNALNMPLLAERAKPGTDLQVFRQAGFEF